MSELLDVRKVLKFVEVERNKGINIIDINKCRELGYLDESIEYISAKDLLNLFKDNIEELGLSWIYCEGYDNIPSFVNGNVYNNEGDVIYWKDSNSKTYKNMIIEKDKIVAKLKENKNLIMLEPVTRSEVKDINSAFYVKDENNKTIYFKDEFNNWYGKYPEYNEYDVWFICNNPS